MRVGVPRRADLTHSVTGAGQGQPRPLPHGREPAWPPSCQKHCHPGSELCACHQCVVCVDARCQRQQLWGGAECCHGCAPARPLWRTQHSGSGSSLPPPPQPAFACSATIGAAQHIPQVGSPLGACHLGCMSTVLGEWVAPDNKVPCMLREAGTCWRRTEAGRRIETGDLAGGMRNHQSRLSTMCQLPRVSCTLKQAAGQQQLP